jgi:hypothetical protein
MRHHRRVLKVKHLAVLVVLASLAMAGCSSEGSTTGSEELDARSQVDAAYEAVASVQIANALIYSKAILASTKDPQIKKFAQEIVTERSTAEDIVKRLRKLGTPMDVKKASHELDVSLKDLAISRNGQPFAAPSTDAGYLKAMRSNLDGTYAAAVSHLGNGGPGTSQLSARLQGSAAHELEQLKQLQE